MTDDPEITNPRDPYRRPDIVTELDRYLVRDETVGFTEMVQRARDEIVALRKLTDGDWVWKQITDTRADALEEAAQRCDRLATDYTIPMSADNWSAGCRGCAARVRALKGER